MPELKRTYRIDQNLDGTWHNLWSSDTPYDFVAESYYEKFRNENPELELRLIAVIEFQKRCGRGRVYD